MIHLNGYTNPHTPSNTATPCPGSPLKPELRLDAHKKAPKSGITNPVAATCRAQSQDSNAGQITLRVGVGEEIWAIKDASM